MEQQQTSNLSGENLYVGSNPIWESNQEQKTKTRKGELTWECNKYQQQKST